MKTLFIATLLFSTSVFAQGTPHPEAVITGCTHRQSQKIALDIAKMNFSFLQYPQTRVHFTSEETISANPELENFIKQDPQNNTIYSVTLKHPRDTINFIFFLRTKNYNAGTFNSCYLTSFRLESALDYTIK